MQTSLLHGQSTRITGALLIAASLLSVVAMAHHPMVTTPDLTQAIQQLKDKAGLSAWVHGILIALMLVSFYAFTEFSLRRGLQQPLVRAGLIAYGAGVVAMIGAASISGFVTAQIPTLAAQTGDKELHVMAMLINLCVLLNRTMANLGAVTMSVGIFAWSLNLVRDAGYARVLGIVGVLIGLSPAVALISGGLHLDVHGMLLVVVLQAVWNVGVGALLMLRAD
jgi:hypothetical protein